MTNQMYFVPAAAAAAAAYLQGVAQKVPLTQADSAVAQRADQRFRSKLVGLVVGSGSDQRPLLRKGKNPELEVESATDFRSLRWSAAHCRKLNLAV